MNVRHAALAAVCLFGCGGDAASTPMGEGEVRQRILDTNDSIVSAMVAGRSTAAWETAEWSGVNLNGTPMTSAGFEGVERSMQYDSIDVIEREVRVYGETAALQWHANFYVHVDGQPSFAEMRLLELFIHRDGRWLLDLTQVTPVFGTVGDPPQN